MDPANFIRPRPAFLVVNDKPEFHALLRYLLEPAGFLLDSAYDGKEAADRVAKNEYAVVLLDVRLPDMKGFGLLKKIRLIKPYQPIAALTSASEPDLLMEKQVRALGSFFCLSMPLEARQLMEVIEECSKTTVPEPAPAPEPVQSEVPSVSAFPASVLRPATSY